MRRQDANHSIAAKAVNHVTRLLSSPLLPKNPDPQLFTSQLPHQSHPKDPKALSDAITLHHTMQSIGEITTPQNPPKRGPRKRIAAACGICQRRKEKCDGQQPCGRCSERGVERECYYIERKSERRRDRRRVAHSSMDSSWFPYQSPRVPRDNDVAISPATSEQYSRLIRDRKGSFMFIGDSANLSFLQIIRRVASECLGSCPLVDDALRSNMVEASPEGQPNWLTPESQRQSPSISLQLGQELIKNFLVATNSVLDLFDETELLEHLPAWMEKRSEDPSIPKAIFALVLALGAQTSSENHDELADKLFTHARYLTAVHYMEDASMSTVQAYALICMYLLGACRRNAAFMYLGIAVRAAYAIGIHRKEISVSFTREEYSRRERLWKALRTLDLFMCASLGRPPSTSETRDTEAGEDYSASNDLCAIFERILIDVYSRRMISTEALRSIGSHHRRWASRFFRGIEGDKNGNSDDGVLPNIGLLHIRAAYYWSIILLTRPFLVESVTLHVKRAHSSTDPPNQPCTTSDSNKVLINACVDSAIRILDLLKGLQERRQLPRRLPFLCNSIFVAALVLGCAYFGDMYQSFPLQRHLRAAQQLLALFSHDLVAQRNASIIGYLFDAAEAHLEKRTAQNMDYQSLAIGSMFGQIHRMRTQGSSRNETPNRSEDNTEDGDNDEGTTPQPSNADQGISVTSQPLAEQPAASEEDYRYIFDVQQDFTDLPFPPMTPRTLWFDALDGNMPLFSTISNSNAPFDAL